MKTLIVVDMQNDFIDGALANPAAQAIVEPMTEYIKNFEGEIIFTADTHYEADYFDSQEGRNLPILHCIFNQHGWKIQPDLKDAAVNKKYDCFIVTKTTFGGIEVIADDCFKDNVPDEIYLCGTCTDICVISVALNLKARFPEIKMYCIADLCAGLTPEKHAAALEVMKSCQVEVI